MSGNGFKDKACTEISNALKEKFAQRPVRKTGVVGNRLRYVITHIKSAFEEYEFVRGKSGVGWDDEAKMATAEADFVERFTEEYGAKYAKCFKKPCQYYNRLVKIFGGNKATGAHILHLSKSKNKSKASSTAPSASASTSASTSNRKHARAPLENLDNSHIISDPAPEDAPSPKPYDDELLPAPVKRSYATIDIESDNKKEQQPPTKVIVRNHDRDRSASGSSSSGGRCASRNAETGTQIAHGLKLISEGMSAPIITKADTSHVDAIVDVFITDPTLLPDDPEGEYYALFLDALSANEMRARVFLKTMNQIQRIALLKRVLTEQEVVIPLNWV
ncbi:hypothetical protein DFH09DRAFT_1321423 [Mycena vulgaris]|nr:hypothetical protein DFH09DRAFT_1321423 [Mycena vulgaris]